MTTRLEYLLGMGNNRSNWLLNSNPSLTYILVKDSSLMYPEPSVNPLNRFFSTTNLTSECDGCFKKAASDFQTTLKVLNGMSDTLAEIYNLDLYDNVLRCLGDFAIIIGENASIFVALWYAIEPELAYIDPNEAKKIRDLAAKAMSSENKRLIDRAIREATREMNQFERQATNAAIAKNQQAWHANDMAARLRKTEVTMLELRKRGATASKLGDAKAHQRFINAIKKRAPKELTLLEDFFNIIAKSSNPIATTLRVLGRLLRNVLKIASVVGLFFVGNQIYDLAVDYFDSMQELCKQHNSDQMDIIAQKYLAADKYFNDMGKCYQAGCCDDEIDCKGLGGWCTRIRNGPDFTYYTHCCDTCDCGGDDACIKAFCSSCDPSSPCSNTGTDNTDDTQTGSGTESLPTYLFQSSLTAKQGCPPLPPGWQRHPNDKDPDPRSSPEWDVEKHWPSCDTFGEFGSWVGDIMQYWQEIFGGINPGNGTSTTAD